MIGLKFCQWLAATPGSRALHESLVMYPLIESIHVWTLAVFVGLAAVLDLRLLGWMLGRVPVSEWRAVAARLAAGFTVMVVTGGSFCVRAYFRTSSSARRSCCYARGLNVWCSRRLAPRANWDLATTPRPHGRRRGVARSLGGHHRGRANRHNWFDRQAAPAGHRQPGRGLCRRRRKPSPRP
jgi:hypothetical protein